MFWKQHRRVPYDVTFSSKSSGKGEARGVGNKDTHPHSWGLSSQATVEHLLFSPRFTVKGNELVRAKGCIWLLAGGNSPQVINFL